MWAESLHQAAIQSISLIEGFKVFTWVCERGLSPDPSLQTITSINTLQFTFTVVSFIDPLCSYIFTPLTSLKNLRKWQLILKAIGLLEPAIHVVQNRHDGEQKSHWDKTNKVDYHLKLFMPFVCLVPVRNFSSPAPWFCTTEWPVAKGLLPYSKNFQTFFTALTALTRLNYLNCKIATQAGVRSGSSAFSAQGTERQVNDEERLI